MPRRTTPIVVPVIVVLVGAALVALGIVRPEEVWTTDKVRLGRAWLGEDGMMIFVCAIGGVLTLFGLVLVFKKR
jgi:hypothetical protein